MENLDSTRPRPSTTEIAARAYHLWEAAGRPDGRALDHWLAAEAQLHAGSAAAGTWGTARAVTEPARPPRLRGIRYGLVLKF